MRGAFIVVAILAQVAVLAFMAGEREWILRTGRVVQLRAAPFDPQDPMRGAYSRLGYEISAVPRARARDGALALFGRNLNRRDYLDARVYAALRVDPTGLAELVSLSDRPPADGLYLRGRVAWAGGRQVQVRYGLEALFLSQAAARTLDHERLGAKAGVPLTVAVAVGRNGLGVIKGHRWEPLGLRVEFSSDPTGWREPPPTTDRTKPRPTRKFAKVTLFNAGQTDVAIVDLPDDGSFRLVPDERFGPTAFRWMEPAPPPPAAGAVVVLRPGASHVKVIDLSQERWWVTDSQGATTTLWNAAQAATGWFRLEYAPPPAATLAGLPQAELVWQGRLRGPTTAQWQLTN